jgi:hypothetical protein
VSVPRGERGSAVVEFTWLGLLLLIPLAYIVLGVFSVQRAAFGAATATREAARAYALAGNTEGAEEAALAAARLALEDQGLVLDDGTLTITCSADPCRTAGATIRVRLDMQVGLPFLPHVFGHAPASIAVHGRHDAIVDCYSAAVVPDDEVCG